MLHPAVLEAVLYNGSNDCVEFGAYAGAGSGVCAGVIAAEGSGEAGGLLPLCCERGKSEEAMVEEGGPEMTGVPALQVGERRGDCGDSQSFKLFC